MSVETSKLKVRCPNCREWAKWGENPFRPFCSEHCRNSDLGKWATEEYKIPQAEGDKSESPDETGSSPIKRGEE